MFGPPGRAYIYLCYGIHHLLNVVTNKEGHADAVLIRAAYFKAETDSSPLVFNGPGKLTKHMGIDRQLNGHDLFAPPLQLTGQPESCLDSIKTSTRVGVDYAGADAALPWRFQLPIKRVGAD